jgi:hypothetical protein
MAAETMPPAKTPKKKLPRIRTSLDCCPKTSTATATNASCRAADGGDNPATAIIAAQARYGNNLVGGHWEVAANSSIGHIAWDPVPTFDTGEVEVELAVDGNTTESVADWTVDPPNLDAVTVSTMAAGYSAIQKVGIRAEVTRGTGSSVGLNAKWITLNVTFLTSGGCSDPFTAGPDCLPFASFPPVVNRRQMMTTNAEMVIVEPGTHCDPDPLTRVQVTGKIQLWSPNAPPPGLGPSQLVIKVYVWKT